MDNYPPPSKRMKHDEQQHRERPLGRRPPRKLTGYGYHNIRYDSLTPLQDEEQEGEQGEQDFMLDARILRASSRRTEREKNANPPIENDTTDMMLDGASLLFVTKKWQGAYKMLHEVVRKDGDIISCLEFSALHLIKGGATSESVKMDLKRNSYNVDDRSFPTVIERAASCLADVAMLLGEYLVDVLQTKGIPLPGSRVARMYLDYNFIQYIEVDETLLIDDLQGLGDSISSSLEIPSLQIKRYGAMCALVEAWMAKNAVFLAAKSHHTTTVPVHYNNTRKKVPVQRQKKKLSDQDKKELKSKLMEGVEREKMSKQDDSIYTQASRKEDVERQNMNQHDKKKVKRLKWEEGWGGSRKQQRRRDRRPMSQPPP